tara:strand:+ start:578 stop:874 length:297 start_codon:yes stop_codon:yes gene_type:complete
MPKLIRLAQIIKKLSASNTGASEIAPRIGEIFINPDNIVFLEDDSLYKEQINQSPGWPSELDDRINITKIYFNTASDLEYNYIYVLGDAANIAEKLGV